ncbi:MAG: tripartite tricarboxylate transporter substrate binding protein [Pigmentiphaga sp.]|uniref:tripartite tricarboxylate transporter substrate binding protein n=1 Tax=Pigmentiphaga sp. TaxID=1977564 RepID=UPI0029ADC241|nr:tripartite tricarboxylate transporter substrate binding protein [Pigmentiphaga sp.]MDX3904365.1 tripartite tricarboxylate transporter substrate binding protein [Pigmentiphaga sp.]
MHSLTDLKKVSKHAVFCLATAAGLGAAHAQTSYPNRLITLVSAYPAGGVTDTSGRIAGEILTEKLGQPTVLENKPGASGMIGKQYVARAKPDGYTLSSGGLGGNVIPAVTMKGLPIDVAKAFVPVAGISGFANVLVVGSHSPVNSAQELVAYARKKGVVTASTNGVGTSAHLTTELFALRTGIKFEHVPYKGGTEAQIGIANGDLDFGFANMTSAVPMIKAGKLKALAVTGAARTDQLPDVPTMGEAGFPDFVVTSWLGLYAPAGTPPEIVKKIGDAVAAGMREQKYMAKAKAAGMDPMPMNAEEFAAFNDAELKRWGDIAKQADISIDFGK